MLSFAELLMNNLFMAKRLSSKKVNKNLNSLNFYKQKRTI